jgi:hypothetical protein
VNICINTSRRSGLARRIGVRAGVSWHAIVTPPQQASGANPSTTQAIHPSFDSLESLNPRETQIEPRSPPCKIPRLSESESHVRAE